MMLRILLMVPTREDGVIFFLLLNGVPENIFHSGDGLEPMR